jgi:phosphoribosylanthranilate isomerase
MRLRLIVNNYESVPDLSLRQYFVPQPTPRVKICCIKSSEEAQMAIRYGASALGLVSAMPSGPGPISENLIAEIVTQVPPAIATFLLTSRQDAVSIIDQQRRTRVNTLQLVDTLTIPEMQTLRSALPGVRLVQVIHVEGPESLEEARVVAPHVDAILLDSGRPRAAVKEFGGTGRVHDWSVSARIRKTVPVPIFLAGGLKPENVREAIEQVEPFGVDVCTGVRTNGSLDEAKLSAFFRGTNPTAERRKD